MNAPSSRPLTGSRLIDCLSFRWLVPVRASGSKVHLLLRDGEAATRLQALCGTPAPLNLRNSPRWRAVHTPGELCNACHALSCAEPSRIDWS